MWCNSFMICFNYLLNQIKSINLMVSNYFVGHKLNKTRVNPYLYKLKFILYLKILVHPTFFFGLSYIFYKLFIEIISIYFFVEWYCQLLKCLNVVLIYLFCSKLTFNISNFKFRFLSNWFTTYGILVLSIYYNDATML